MLRQHLRRCEPCQTYRNFLGRFHVALDLDREIDLQPDLAAREGLREALHARTYPVPRSSLRRRLVQLTRMRPIHRAILGAAAVVLVLLVVDEFPASAGHARAGLQPGEPAACARIDAYEVVHRLQMALDQKLGQHRVEGRLPVPLLFTHPEPADST